MAKAVRAVSKLANLPSLLKAWNQLWRGCLTRRHEPGSDDVSDLSLRRARELVVRQYWVFALYLPWLSQVEQISTPRFDCITSHLLTRLSKRRLSEWS